MYYFGTAVNFYNHWLRRPLRVKAGAKNKLSVVHWTWATCSTHRPWPFALFGPLRRHHHSYPWPAQRLAFLKVTRSKIHHVIHRCAHQALRIPTFGSAGLQLDHDLQTWFGFSSPLCLGRSGSTSTCCRGQWPFATFHYQPWQKGHHSRPKFGRQQGKKGRMSI